MVIDFYRRIISELVAAHHLYVELYGAGGYALAYSLKVIQRVGASVERSCSVHLLWRLRRQLSMVLYRSSAFLFAGILLCLWFIACKDNVVLRNLFAQLNFFVVFP